MSKNKSPSHEIVLEFKAPTAGNGAEREVPIQMEAVQAVKDLMCAHHKEIVKAREENNGRVSLAFTINVDDTTEQPKVRTTMAFASRFRDVREVDINVNQKLFAFDGAA